MGNSKGQAPALSMVLIIAILIIIIVLTYTWGKSIYDAQKTRTTVDYMTAKLFEIKSAVLAVSREGLNSTRIVKIDIPEGTLILNNGSFCTDFLSGNRMHNNSVVYNITTTNKLIDSDSWISIDPGESNTSCDALYENNSIAVLMGKSEQAGNSYVNSYTMWFRNLTQDNGLIDNFYVINVTGIDSMSASGGSYTLAIRNYGTQNISYTIYTTVRVDII